MSIVKVINIASDFSRFPGGRFREDGPFSGQEFREDILMPALKNYDKVEINFDGVAGYAASFLEEAFGGAVAELNKDYEMVAKKIKITISDDPDLATIVDQYMKKASL